MHRLVLVLLIALLPLQAIWAAAANACGHEHMSGKAHFGHHEHVHTAKAIAAADDVPDAAGAAEWSCGADCSTCHGHGWSAALLDSPPALTQAGPGFIPSAYEHFIAQRYPDNPLRPPLARLI